MIGSLLGRDGQAKRRKLPFGLRAAGGTHEEYGGRELHGEEKSVAASDREEKSGLHDRHQAVASVTLEAFLNGHRFAIRQGPP